jgi:uncharacterized repeat protein (TIGR03803 family)
MAGETVLHNFSPYPQGNSPQANVCLGPGGKIYSTTAYGGSANAGVVYSFNNAGNQTVLYSFTGGADGANPYANVLCDSAGNLNGTTLFGGSSGAGVVFRISGAGHESVLYSFTGGADGGNPFYGLIQDSAGNLYGTTDGGGSAGVGVVFKLDKKGHETVLYSFTGGVDGAFPNGLIHDSAGNLYGTTQFGGAFGAGVVFKLDPIGNETVLYSFTGAADGGSPFAGVVEDSAGNLYGTTNGGGSGGAGVVFKLDAVGHETVLYSFTGGGDGGYPSAGVTLDSVGNLYGTTSFGGSAGAGVVFKVDTAGNETVLNSFTGGKDGGYPFGGVIADLGGNLYGNTSGGGTAGVGALFKLDPAGHETVLYGFPGSDGGNPYAGVIQDSAGNLYGTTLQGGTDGVGVVYKLDPRGRETLLHTFTGGADGGSPYAGLIQDSAGNLDGTTQFGGAFGAGVVFKLDTSGNETVLYNFTGGADGGFPYTGQLMMDSAGNLYGTTLDGGSAGKGVIFKIDPMGHESVLHSFTGPDGAYPYSGVIMDSAGTLYGTTSQGGTRLGVVYKLDATGHYTVLHNFTFGADGGLPWGGLILDAANNLYGTTWSGGPPSGDYPGVVYKVDAAGNFSVLYTFTGFSDGGGSRSNLVLDSAGNLYGTTQYGGQGPCSFFGCGVVFELDPGGHQTVLYSFAGGSDGSEPGTGLIRDASGNLYGTTSEGGTAFAGVVYKVTASADSPASAPPVQESMTPSGPRPRNFLLGEPTRKWEETGARNCPARLPGMIDLACRQ